MKRVTVFMLSAVVLALCLGQATASRELRGAAAPAASLAGRALKQVGDAFTRWGGQGAGIDDGARSYGTVYSQISGKYEPGLGNNYGYYGSPTAAAYFGAGYPSQSELALARMNPSASSLQSRLYARNARYNSLYPYDF